MCEREMHTKFWYGNLNEKGIYENKGVDGQFMELVTGCNLTFIQYSHSVPPKNVPSVTSAL
jgi:hypothetical protein